MSKLLFQDIAWFNQRQAEEAGSISCFPTSMSMETTYLLQLTGMDKTQLGCSEDMLLEDYFNQVIDSKEMGDWITNNPAESDAKYIAQGYRRREFYTIEAHAFNMIAKQFNFPFKATYKNIRPATVMSEMERTQLPVVMGGYFKSVSTVGGHLNCIVGIEDDNTFIVHDPWGNAMTGYQSKEGAYCKYNKNFYTHENGCCNVIIFERV